MLAKRIIPCLDIKNGMTVKGINFVNIKEVGDPVELGAWYAEQGADELVFLKVFKPVVFMCFTISVHFFPTITSSLSGSSILPHIVLYAS
mgnify:CR=1 FL=1